MSENEEKFTGHEYDGIQELDNPLPTWWLWTFIATVGFGFIYYLHYETGAGPSLQEELQSAMSVISAQQKKHAATAEMNLADIDAAVAAADLKTAQQAFVAKCAVCHGNELQGGIGPNLTDEYWMHGKGFAADIVKTVQTGVLDKGMPAWSALMTPQEIIAVSAFILSKKDSHPANAKAPQGEKVR